VRALVSRHQVIAFFLAAYAITWVVWVPRALVHQGLLDWTWPDAVGRAWSYGPALAAVLIACLARGGVGPAELWAGLRRWRVGWCWYALVLAVPFVVSTSAMWLYERLTVLPAEWPVQQPTDLLVYPVFLLILGLTDGVGEEVGWRGFALPGMQRQMRPAFAAILLGGLWAGWHLPLFWTHGAALEGRSPALLLVALIPTSVLFTWVFNHTGASILLMILLHATHNLAGPPLPSEGGPLLTPYLLSVLLKWLLAIVVLAVDPAFRPTAVARGRVAASAGSG
jgi:membrane protease YdiL (CAAX protease family)